MSNLGYPNKKIKHLQNSNFGSIIALPNPPSPPPKRKEEKINIIY